jgi:hypothetical protein
MIKIAEMGNEIITLAESLTKYTPEEIDNPVAKSVIFKNIKNYLN